MLVTTNEIDVFGSVATNSKFLEDLRVHLEDIKPEEIISKRTAAIMDNLASWTPSEGILTAKQNIAAGAIGKQSANNRLDFIFRLESLNQYIPIEVTFNNREAIGTNFLKLESFGRHLGLNASCPFGILIAPTRSLLEYGGWDSAYADNLEYEALRTQLYKPVLSLPTVIVELHGVF